MSAMEDVEALHTVNLGYVANAEGGLEISREVHLWK